MWRVAAGLEHGEVTYVDPGRLLAAAMRPHGLVELERETGELCVRLAQQVQRLLDDPDVASQWPREVRVLRERRDRRRSVRQAESVRDGGQRSA